MFRSINCAPFCFFLFVQRLRAKHTVETTSRGNHNFGKEMTNRSDFDYETDFFDDGAFLSSGSCHVGWGVPPPSSPAPAPTRESKCIAPPPNLVKDFFVSLKKSYSELSSLESTKAIRRFLFQHTMDIKEPDEPTLVFLREEDDSHQIFECLSWKPFVRPSNGDNKWCRFCIDCSYRMYVFISFVGETETCTRFEISERLSKILAHVASMMK